MNEDGEPYPSFFRLAKRVSKLSDYKIQMGAVITKNSTVISIGHNKLKYNKLLCNPLKKLHAEMVAVKLAGRGNLTGCTIYVYREGHNGIPRIAKPCEDCERLLRKMKIKKIIYSTSEYPYFEVLWLS